MPTETQRADAVARGKCRECCKRKARKDKKTCGICSQAAAVRVKRNREKKAAK